MPLFMKCLVIEFFLGVSSLASGAPDRAADRAELTHKKQVIWPALYAERDARGLEAFLLEEFRILEPEGSVRTGDAEVAWLASTPPSDGPDDFFFSIQEIVFPAADVAMVYGHGDSTRTDEQGRPCHHRYWSSNLFVRTKAGWKPAFSHVSGARCSPQKEAMATKSRP